MMSTSERKPASVAGTIRSSNGLNFDLAEPVIYDPSKICGKCGQALRPNTMHVCQSNSNPVHGEEEKGGGSLSSMRGRQRNQVSNPRNEIEEEKVPQSHDRPIYRGFYAAIGDADIPIEEKIERLKTTIDDFEFLEKQYQCIICITEFRLKDIIVPLPCHESHVYHYTCYKAYIISSREQGKNPMCLGCNENNLDDIKVKDSGAEEAKRMPQFSIGDMVQNTIIEELKNITKKLDKYKVKLLNHKYLNGLYKCLICKDLYLASEEIVPLKCRDKHTYHYKCLLEHCQRVKAQDGTPACIVCKKQILD